MKDEEEKELDNVDSPEVLEFEFNEDGEEDLKKTIKKLRDDLKVIKAEKEEYLTGWQKERADFANFKRLEGDRRASYKEVVEEHILTRFLSVLDSFNMAFQNKEAWEKVDASWRTGVEYIYAQFNTIFEEYGIKEIGEVGESFDPHLHHSIEATATDKQEDDHKISFVVQKGYKLGERVVRPARVKVFEYEFNGKG